MNDLISLLDNMQNNDSRLTFKFNGQSIFADQFLQDVKTLKDQVSQHPYHRWALCYQNSYRFSVALFAVLTAGFQPILLPNNRPGTVEKFSDEFGGILSDLDDIHGTDLSNVSVEQEQKNRRLLLDNNQSIILFTSGSTGTPKKISRSLKHFMNEISVLDNHFNQNKPGISVYSSVSHQHIYGLIFYILWPFCAENVICYPLLEYPESVTNVLQADLPAFFISSPSLLSRLEEDGKMLKDLTIFSSGGLLKKHDATRTHKTLGIYPIEVLGSTETSGVAYRQQDSGDADKSWMPLKQVNIQVDQTTGCLAVTSPFFESDGPFLMGDQAKIEDNGTFKLLERADRIAKIEGKRVSLAEIESVLKSIPFIEDAYALPMETHRQYIAVVAVLTQTGKKTLGDQGKLWLNTELRKYLSQQFDRVLLPKQFRYVDKIPMNAQGKYVMDDIQKIFEESI